MLTHHEAVLRGRIGAYAQHATHDTRETTARARAAFLSRFDRQVDPERVLPEAERRRRAEAAKKAHFARLALASARSRRNRQIRDAKSVSAPVNQTAATDEEVRDDGTVTQSSQ